MATSHSSQPDEAQISPYHSYEALQRDNLPVRLSPDAQRLFWPLDGPLYTSISIIRNFSSPDSLEPYFQQTTGSAGTWHAVSQSPLTVPEVSSITVAVYDLELWEDSWLEEHEEHSSPDGDDDEDEPRARYGALSDPDPEKAEEGSEHLLMCCDEERPRGKAVKLVVKPAAGGGGFVTVHDYVSAVHPWLMSIRDDILKAMSVLDQPVPLVTDLMVNSNGPEQLMIEDKENWIEQRRN